jgi:hypothetical protein
LTEDVELELQCCHGSSSPESDKSEDKANSNDGSDSEVAHFMLI